MKMLKKVIKPVTRFVVMIMVVALMSLQLAMLAQSAQAIQATMTNGMPEPVDFTQGFNIAENAKSIEPTAKFLAPIIPIEGLPDFAEYIPISNRAELEAISNNLSGKYYLTNDIDLAGMEWEPIGASYFNAFTGIFDGQEYVISNMVITGDREYSGLFGYVRDTTIKNVGLEDTYIEISQATMGMAIAGGVCGVVSGTSSIDNCYNTGDVSAYPASSGNCTVSIGGIFGTSDTRYTSTIAIKFCYNTSNVAASCAKGSSYAGGISGSDFLSHISSTTISNCYNTGNVSAFSASGAYVGGICAFSFDVTSDCYNTGDISAISSEDGFAYAGGIWGKSYSGSGRSHIISNCHSTGKISANSSLIAYAGGICGANDPFNDFVESTPFIITNCYNGGDVFATAINNYDAYAGGICGDATWYTGSDNRLITINNCYNVGNVTSSSSYSAFAGGICGYCTRTTINNCYNAGNVANTQLALNAYIGGICGSSWFWDDSYLTLGDCYWRLESGQIVNGVPRNDVEKNGVGYRSDTTASLTSLAMKSQASFIGFDFENDWGFNRAEYDYPVLRVFGDVDISSTSVMLGNADYTKGQVEVFLRPLKIPVSIIDNPGFASFLLAVTYDPAVLTAVGVENGTVWGGSITKNLTGTGIIVLAGASASVITGDGSIAVIEFEVNHTAADGTYPLIIEIEELKTVGSQVNQMDVPHAKADSAVTISSVMRGDVYEDGFIRASDSTEILLHLAELKELTERQTIAAKITTPLNDPVSIFDANEILLIAARLKPPLLQFSSMMSPMAISGFTANLVEPVDLSVGAATGMQGDTVTIPIRIANNSGFSAFDFRIDYDETRLTPIGAAKGSAWSDDIVENADADGGECILINGISDANSTADGAIINLSFKINEDANPGTANISLTVSKLGYINGAYEVVALPNTVNNGQILVGMQQTQNTISGQVQSYNPKSATQITLYEAGSTTKVIASIMIEALATTDPNPITQPFTLNDVPAGKYDLVITKGGHLSYTITNIAVEDKDIDLTSNVTKAYSTITLLAGDVDGDGIVSTPDLTLLLNRFGGFPTKTDPHTDINGDGIVSTPDLTILLNNFGKKNGDCIMQY